MKRKERIEDLIKTILAYIIFAIICIMCIVLFVLILKLMAWLLSIVWVRNTILVLCFICSATMLHIEFRKGE